MTPESVTVAPNDPLNERLVMLVAPVPKADTVPESVALVVVTALAALVVTVGPPTGQMLVVNESVEPEPESERSLMALAVTV